MIASAPQRAFNDAAVTAVARPTAICTPTLSSLSCRVAIRLLRAGHGTIAAANGAGVDRIAAQTRHRGNRQPPRALHPTL